jgi:hypothetical protein
VHAPDRSAWWTLAPTLLAAAFAVAVVPVAVFGLPATSEAADEAAAHLPTVLQFARELPAPDLRDYPSATGPGYHLVLAVASRVGAGTTALRLMSAAAGLALVLLAWRGAARWAGPGAAFALALPVLLSSYVLSGSAWLTTDVASVLLGSTVVATCAWTPPAARMFLVGAVLFAAAMAVRQTNMFLALPLLAAGAFGSPLGRSASPGEQWHGDEPRTWGRLGMALLAVVPGAVVLAALAVGWGGLTPPHFRHLHDRGISPVALPYGLALVGAWGTFLLLPLLSECIDAVRRRPAAVLAPALVAAALASVPDSSWSRDEGRWGGPLWTLVERSPVIAGRSPLIVLGAAGGAAALAALWVRAAQVGRGRHASVVISALLGLFAVQCGNSQVWERYFDPAILVSLAWLVAMGLGPRRPHSTSRAVVGAALLAAAQGTVSVANYLLPAFRG